MTREEVHYVNQDSCANCDNAHLETQDNRETWEYFCTRLSDFVEDEGKCDLYKRFGEKP